MTASDDAALVREVLVGWSPRPPDHLRGPALAALDRLVALLDTRTALTDDRLDEIRASLGPDPLPHLPQSARLLLAEVDRLRIALAGMEAAYHAAVVDQVLLDTRTKALEEIAHMEKTIWGGEEGVRTKTVVTRSTLTQAVGVARAALSVPEKEEA